MEQIKPLPVDMDTWRLLGYDPLYYVANSAIKFYENRLTELGNNLTDVNKSIFRESISTIEKMIK